MIGNSKVNQPLQRRSSRSGMQCWKEKSAVDDFNRPALLINVKCKMYVVRVRISRKKE